MLTLFKPWRQGQELLGVKSDWSQAFQDYTFTTRQLELMDKFNVIHECLDARDDYRAQLKAGAEIVNSWGDMADESDDIIGKLSIDTVFPHDDVLEDIDLQDGTCVGPSHHRHMAAMEAMHCIMQQTSWDKSKKAEAIKKFDYPPLQKTISGSEWKKHVLDCRQQVLDKKQGKPPIKDDSSSNAGSGNSKDDAEHEKPLKKFTYDKVEILDKSYLEKSFFTGNDKDLIASCIKSFKLNLEQERAFHIIVNHAVCHSPEPLHMYIGGMGGTGKSQVLKAVSKFFSDRDEPHRFIVLAPTGNAAALLGGSTYHSVLGINERASENNLPQVRERLLGVDYIFIDEVSMLSAHDLYKISVRLCKARDNLYTPFGSMNIIVAGDFAQLPPAMGGEYAALYSRGNSGKSNKEQEQSIGCTVWHGFTSVVMLRQNLRQQSQSIEDDKFRTVLVNM
ncbi:hypothetical protein D9758_015159 [Tetrapyrgos nigripes]|uniref:ATP-dependent DNA helicase n=1 Tax=Tetrapyrgos nigripes TaxID=182062 RepID=A0A8H5CPK3_9AGAR|nr:hypothetical protein D9758_015159 [Tetrapyrgos nigripes]